MRLLFSEDGLAAKIRAKIVKMTDRERERGGQQQLSRRRGRRRQMMLDHEIDLYCNPFVEVYLRLSRYTRKLTRRYLARLTGVAFVLQDNFLWRNVLAVASFTVC